MLTSPSVFFLLQYRHSPSDLFAAAKAGDSNQISAILQAAKSKSETSRLCLALIWTITIGDLEATDRLLSSGVEVNTFFSYMQLPLITAVLTGRAAMVKLLLERGADPNSTTIFCQKKDFDCECQWECERISGSERLLATKGVKLALNLAIVQKNLEMVRMLIEHGARVDLTDCSGANALHLFVCTYRYTKWRDEHCSLLTDMCHGQNAAEALNMKWDSLNWWTPIHISVGQNRERAAYILIKAGAILDTRGKCTPTCERGCRSGHTPLLEKFPFFFHDLGAKLVVHGADTKEKDSLGWSLIDRCLWGLDKPTTACKLLVFTGCRMYHTSSDHKELCDWLQTRQCNAHRLDNLTRIFIRTFVKKEVVRGKSIVDTILRLPLPKSIKDYLLMKDIIEFNEL